MAVCPWFVNTPIYFTASRRRQRQESLQSFSNSIWTRGADESSKTARKLENDPRDCVENLIIIFYTFTRFRLWRALISFSKFSTGVRFKPAKSACRPTIFPWFWSAEKRELIFDNVSLFMLCASPHHITLTRESPDSTNANWKLSSECDKWNFLLNYIITEFMWRSFFWQWHHPAGSASVKILTQFLSIWYIVIHRHQVNTRRAWNSPPPLADRISTNCNLLHTTRDIGWCVYALPNRVQNWREQTRWWRKTDQHELRV